MKEEKKLRWMEEALVFNGEKGRKQTLKWIWATINLCNFKVAIEWWLSQSQALSSMSLLPDELWRRILEIGVQSGGFSYKDLCCLSISCRRFHRLSDEDLLWSHLLSADFPSSSSSSAPSSNPKSLYKLRYRFYFYLMNFEIYLF